MGGEFKSVGKWLDQRCEFADLIGGVSEADNHGQAGGAGQVIFLFDPLFLWQLRPQLRIEKAAANLRHARARDLRGDHRNGLGDKAAGAAARSSL